MDLEGKRFRIKDQIWIVDTVITGSAAKLVGQDFAFIRLEGSSDSFDNMRKVSIKDVVAFIEESPAVYDGDWPIIVTHGIHGEKWGLDEELEELGLNDEQRHHYKYVAYELVLTVELYEDGSHAITHVNKKKLPQPITD